MFNFFSRSSEPIKLWFDTDIHCHLIPGVDDGSPDVETSLSLVTGLAELGINRIWASPHVARDTFENTPESLAAAQDELDVAMRAYGLGDIRLSHHAENRVDDLFNENLENGTLLTLPGNYLLIENSFVQEPWDLDRIIFDLQVRGFRPIMAHPERYLYYHEKPKRYEELHRNIPFQVNVLSLAGYYGKHVRKMAEELVEAGMVDYLGTDCHGSRHIDCLREYLASRDARRHRDMLASRIRNDRFSL